MTDQSTAPGVGDDSFVADTEVDDALDLDIDGGSEDLDLENEEEAPEETEEFEYDGKKHAIPKSLRDAFMQRAEFTQKSQALAEERRTVEASKAALEQRTAAANGYAAEATKLAVIEAHIEQYAKLDWVALANEDPAQAQRLRFAYDQLKEQRDEAKNTLSQKQQEVSIASIAQHNAAVEHCKTVLQRDIPGWSADVAAKTVAFGQQHGFTTDELRVVSDPRMIKVLHLAMVGSEALQKTKTVQRHAAAAATRPAATVGGAAPAQRSTTNATGDKLSTAEWMRRENERLAKRGRR